MRRFSSNPGESSEGGPYWVPQTDVYIAEDGNLVIEVELGGMHREDLELTIEGNRLKIQGQRPDGGRRRRCRYLVTELQYGRFESVIEVPPDYDLSLAKAAYQNGILRIDVPRKP